MYLYNTTHSKDLKMAMIKHDDEKDLQHRICKILTSELKIWVDEYIQTHKCFQCGGTGIVPSDDRVCRTCDGHGIYPRPEMPSSDEILRQMSNTVSLEVFRLNLQRKRALCDVKWGKYM